MKIQLSQSASLDFSLGDYFKANMDAWNQKVSFDVQSSYYNLSGFRNGASSLCPLSLSILEDIKGKRVLHLQSYIGLDSLSMARMGAEVVGVDFCINAVHFAESLSRELGSNAIFICANVYDIDELELEKFDLIFMSYGAICWLPEMDTFFKKAKGLLRSGGEFKLIDFHPLAISFNLFQDKTLSFDYFNHKHQPLEIHRKGTYADLNAPIETLEYNWNHDMGEIVTALLASGFAIGSLAEYPYLPTNGFPNLELHKDGYYHVTGANDKYPLLFSVTATKS